MNVDNKFWTIAGFVVGLLSLVFAGVSYYFNREKSTSLEIKRVGDVELTKPLNVDKLSSLYFYDDSIPVQHLWQSTFVLTNCGEQTLLGKGFTARNIREDALKLHFSNSHILSLEVVTTNSDISLIGDALLFSQWKPKEYVELKVLSDGSTAPDMSINEYDIQNGTVIYTKYSPDEKEMKRSIADRLPYAATQGLWWVTIIYFTLMLLYFLIKGTKEYRKQQGKIAKVAFVVIWVIMIALLYAPLLWML